MSNDNGKTMETRALVIKIAIVAALVIVVGVVVAMKQSKEVANQPLTNEAVQTHRDGDGSQSQSNKNTPRLVDLGADKCIPCKMMAPILEELKKEYAGQMKVEFIDVWKNKKAAEEYGIQSIPTQIFYDASGKEVFRHEGFFSKEDILDKCKDLGFNLNKGKSHE